MKLVIELKAINVDLSRSGSWMFQEISLGRILLDGIKHLTIKKLPLEICQFYIEKWPIFLEIQFCL